MSVTETDSFGLDSLQNPLTLEELREELCLKFEMMNRRGRIGQLHSSPGEEHALFACGFKGKSNNCGKARDCRNKNGPKNEGQKRGNDRNKDIECFYCKKKGHQIADCHKLMQKQKEQANICIDQGSGNKNNSNDNEKVPIVRSFWVYLTSKWKNW